MLLYYLETVVVVLLVGFLIRFIVPAVDAQGRSIRSRRNKLAADYRLRPLDIADVERRLDVDGGELTLP